MEEIISRSLSRHANEVLATTSFTPRAAALPDAVSEWRDFTRARLQYFHQDEDRLAPKEAAAWRSAREFLAEQYQALGVRRAIPKILTYRRCAYRVDGEAYIERRAAWACYHPIGSHRMSMPELVAVRVHELSHAAGKLVVGANGKRSGLQFPCTDKLALHQAGWIVYPPAKRRDSLRLRLFSVMEEFAAMTHENRCLIARGFEPIVSALWAHFPVRCDKARDQALCRAVIALEAPGRYTELERHAAARDWGSVLKIEGLTSVRIKVPLLTVADHQSSYEALVAALDRLAPEVYPALTPQSARARFGDDAARVQAGAPHRLVTLPLKAAFGAEGLRFLAELLPTGPRTRDMACLALFAEASKLPAPARAKVRTLICRAAKRR